MAVNPHKYNITIREVEIDGGACFEARVKELPDICEFGDTYEEAYELAIDSIVTTAEVFAEKNRTMPDPILPMAEYSGRVTLRLPKTLHRTLAETAEEEHVSLNQLLVTAVAHFAGSRQSIHMFGTVPGYICVISSSLSPDVGTFLGQGKHRALQQVEAPRYYGQTAVNSSTLLLNCSRAETCEAIHG